jgi:ribosome-binding ATPase YchF (GTP1/OBG family)
VQAAGTIHTDFERGFICAEVMKFDELKEIGSENAVKAAGGLYVLWGGGRGGKGAARRQ